MKQNELQELKKLNKTDIELLIHGLFSLRDNIVFRGHMILRGKKVTRKEVKALTNILIDLNTKL